MIRQLEVTHRTRAAPGALIGGIIGTVLGFWSGRVAADVCETNCIDPNLLMLAGTIDGVLLGALFGSTARVWTPAP